eukprot:5171120-Pleurochrysis_carterae.AAC.1
MLVASSAIHGRRGAHWRRRHVMDGCGGRGQEERVEEVRRRVQGGVEGVVDGVVEPDGEQCGMMSGGTNACGGAEHEPDGGGDIDLGRIRRAQGHAPVIDAQERGSVNPATVYSGKRETADGGKGLCA